MGCFMQLFEPVSIKACTDVNVELKKICDTYAIEEQMVSFDILHINTLYRGEKKKDFNMLSKEECTKILGNEAQYNDNTFEIRQVYDIVLRGIKEGDLAPFVALHMDSECYELSLELKAGLEVCDDDAFFNELYAQITREKIRQHIIIRLFDKDTQEEIQSLKELLNSLSISGQIESTRRIVIAKAGGFIPNVDCAFKFVLEDEWNASHEQRLEFASYAAKSGDLVGLSMKAQEGMSGRNLKGEYIHVKKQEAGIPEVKLRFKESDFRSEDTQEAIAYYALQDGYVAVGEGELRILTDFNFPEVSLRKNGSLLGGDKKGFIVEVACTDSNVDAIGAGIVLEAEEVKIYGSVAENAKVIAKKVEINGQTHQSATIKADEISIDMHKGLAIGEKIHINRLELGEVDAQKIFIEQANGGNVMAREVEINNLHSHTKITLSHQVHIKNMSGGENRFMISSRASSKEKEGMQHINARIKENIQSMNTILNVLNKDLALVRKTKPVVEKIKVIMEENKRNRKPNERNITESVAQYVVLLRRTKYLKDRLLVLQEESKKLNAHLEKLDKQTQNAIIMLDVPWQKENEITYESFFPEAKDMLLINDGEETYIGINKEQLKLQKIPRDEYEDIKE